MKKTRYELTAGIEICFSRINSYELLKSGEDLSEVHGQFFTTDEFWDRLGEYTYANCSRDELESTVDKLKFDIEYGSGLLIDKVLREKYAGETVSCVSTKLPSERIYISGYDNVFLETGFLVEIDANYASSETVDLNMLFGYIREELGSFTDLGGFGGMITDTTLDLTSSDQE